VILINKGTGPIWEPSSEEFKEIVSSSSSYKEMLVRLGSNTIGGHYKTLKRRIFFEGIDDSELDKRRTKLRSEINKNKVFKKASLEEMLTKDSYYSSKHIKNRLLENELIKNECKLCGLPPFWNGKKLVLQLDHENGDSRDNTLENLRLLCPNCHTQTETFAGRNSKVRKEKKVCICTSCGVSIHKTTKSGLCRKCSTQFAHDNGKYIYKNKNGKEFIKPSKDELLILVIENGFMGTGRKYGVTGNAVKKWCIGYGIDIKNEIKLHWESEKYSKNRSGLKFVRIRQREGKKFLVAIWYKDKTYFYGSYQTREEAAQVADEKMIELFGEDVLTNKKLGLI
jgi:Zn finger protein HypA/HybF involved in hydrogenase expression